MATLFGEQLYPTPSTVIWDMTSGLELHHKRILDPSAGRGDILDNIASRSRYGSEKSDLYAIEIDPDLRQVLTGKGYKVIDSDFLKYSGQMYFDYILMNPPFKDGDSHLLKAWEISNGALIRCLLNAETIRNPRTQERQQLKRLIEQFGQVKDLGRPFLKSANPSPVEVVMVTLQDTRPKESFRVGFDPATIGQDTYRLEEIDNNELAPADIFENYEARYRATIAAFKELLEARQKVAYYLKDLIASSHETPEGIISKAVGKPSADLAYNEFLDTSTKLAWDGLFRKTKLSNVTTEHYPENRVGVEGWKTNAGYAVGKKFILPYIGSNWGDGLDYQQSRHIDDLEKALCFISGKRFEDITNIRDVYNHKSHFGQWMTSEFFLTQLYQRHTMHFKWRDENLRQEFNSLAARHRWGWIPEKVKTGAYK